MIFQSHFVSMVVYAALEAVVLALLRRNERKARWKYGIFLFLSMAGGALLFGWLMYLFTL